MSSTVFEINSIAICPFSKLIVYSLEFTLLELSAVKYTVLFIALGNFKYSAFSSSVIFSPLKAAA